MIVAGLHIRIARTLAGADQDDFAHDARVAASTLRRAERWTLASKRHERTVNGVLRAVEARGLMLLDDGDTRAGGPGVRAARSGEEAGAARAVPYWNQIKAGRLVAGWSQSRLAEISGVALATVKRAEVEVSWGSVREALLLVLADTLISRGGVVLLGEGDTTGGGIGARFLPGRWRAPPRDGE